MSGAIQEPRSNDKKAREDSVELEVPIAACGIPLRPSPIPLVRQGHERAAIRLRMIERLGEDRRSPVVAEIKERRGAVVLVRTHLPDHPSLLVERRENAPRLTGRRDAAEEQKKEDGFHDDHEQCSADAIQPTRYATAATRESRLSA